MADTVDIHNHFAPKPVSQETLAIEEVQAIVQATIRMIESQKVTPTMVRDLQHAVRTYTTYFETGVQDNVKFDESFNLSDEVGELITGLKILRETVFCPITRKLKEGVKAGDARDIITTSSQMINMLIKTQEKVMNMERFRAVEQSTIEVLKYMQDHIDDVYKAVKAFKDTGLRGDGPILDMFFSSMRDRVGG